MQRYTVTCSYRNIGHGDRFWIGIYPDDSPHEGSRIKEFSSFASFVAAMRALGFEDETIEKLKGDLSLERTEIVHRIELDHSAIDAFGQV